MRISLDHKTVLWPVLAIMTAALLALPFLAQRSKRIAVYTNTAVSTINAKNIAKVLKKEGYTVFLNPTSAEEFENVLWFAAPEAAKTIDAVQVPYKFLYSEEFYPFDWQGLKNPPVVLTPHRALFEHYARANIKTAMVSFFDVTAEQKADLRIAAKRFGEILSWLRQNRN